MVYPITTQAVLEAVRAVERYQFAYWDALIWATAKLNNVLSILTEDRPSSPMIEGVCLVDPFVATFEIAQLG